MTHFGFALAVRIRGSIQDWLHHRWHESVHCWQCQGAVTPWDTYCPVCGQRNPARLSKSVAVLLGLGFLFLAIGLSAVILSF